MGKRPDLTRLEALRRLIGMTTMPSDQMTPAQEDHLVEIQKEFGDRLQAKYRKGQAEHGGNLWDVPVMSLLDEAIDEAVDQVTYLLTIRVQLNKKLREIAAIATEVDSSGRS